MPEHKPDTAVLLLGFGGPEKFDDVLPFISNVVHGRDVPEDRIAAVVEQYRTIGGRSPFNELTFAQAKALQKHLLRESVDVEVHVGMLFWHPYIAETISKLHSDGIKRVVAIIMAPHRTEASYNRYVEAVESAMKQLPDSRMVVEFVSQWHGDPLFISAIADQVDEQLSELGTDCGIIFTAHSVPKQMSDASQYAAQVRQTAALVSAKLCEQHGPLSWMVAFQSRSGSPKEPWLEPDVKSRLEQMQSAGKRRVIVVPIGFVCDHVEVLYDLDVQATQEAKACGLKMRRANTVGVHPEFINLLSDLAREKLESFHAKSERK